MIKTFTTKKGLQLLLTTIVLTVQYGLQMFDAFDVYNSLVEEPV